MTRSKGLLASIVLVTVLTIGAGWWRWQAPYRTLTVFLNALYSGDIKTLYALAPNHERLFVTEKLVNDTYQRFLKPLLIRHFPKDSLVRVQRDSDRPRSYLFYLWFRGQEKPLVVYLCYPPDRQGWRVPFSYFVWLTARGMYGDPKADLLMRRWGYVRVATPEGGSFSLSQ